MPSSLMNKFFSFIDQRHEDYIKSLQEAVAIPSVSGKPEYRKDVIRMVEWTAKRLRTLKCDVKEKFIGFEKLPDGTEIPLPPIILASLGNDPQKKTVCIYGHLDVQPAALNEGWNSEPFELTERDGKLYGRGASDDKGPVLCWLHAIEAFETIGKVPVNVRFILESMEESGSAGLQELLFEEKDNFFSDTDYICISDNYWLGTERPTITYGLKGLAYFHVTVKSSDIDLHSGMYGGAVREGIDDLIYLLNSMKDKHNKITIKNFYNNVLSVDPEEQSLYKDILFDVDEYRSNIGCTKLLHDDKVDLLINRWTRPSLSIHGIEGAFDESGSKTSIAKRVIGKFSIRFVPNHTAKEVEELVKTHLEEKWNELESPNDFNVSMSGSGETWIEDPTNPNYLAGIRATELVYGVKPDLIRDGGTIPILSMIKKLIGKNVLLLPVGQGDDGAHSQNEKLNKENYIKGIKLLGAYLHEVSQI
ncbi:hypothetical protein FQA39_LY05777 [Lamprigera yunnana]|nr:hypothetical protein FQA39_LY05777 [Lamprigera yunnana]